MGPGLHKRVWGYFLSFRFCVPPQHHRDSSEKGIDVLKENFEEDITYLGTGSIRFAIWTCSVPTLESVTPEVTLFKGKLELMEGRREITLFWLWPSPQDGTLRPFAASWLDVCESTWSPQKLEFLKCLPCSRPSTHSASKGRWEELCQRLNHLLWSWL